jgi:hypothetical protein
LDRECGECANKEKSAKYYAIKIREGRGRKVSGRSHLYCRGCVRNVSRRFLIGYVVVKHEALNQNWLHAYVDVASSVHIFSVRLFCITCVVNLSFGNEPFFLLAVIVGQWTHLQWAFVKITLIGVL